MRVARCVDAGFAEGEDRLGYGVKTGVSCADGVVLAEFDEEVEESWSGGEDYTLGWYLLV